MITLTLSPKQLHILQHSLGVDDYGQGRQYRNHFVTGPESDDFADCRALVEMEFMKDHGPQNLTGGMHTFTVTPAGVDAVAFQSPVPPPQPKLTRSQKRYRDYVDADSGLSFSEWLGITR